MADNKNPTCFTDAAFKMSSLIDMIDNWLIKSTIYNEPKKWRLPLFPFDCCIARVVRSLIGVESQLPTPPGSFSKSRQKAELCELV